MGSRDTIETLNALPLPQFHTHFWPTDEPLLASADPLWSFTLQSSSTISPQDLSQCFQLISDTSSAQYATSSLAWHPALKRKEMYLPDLKYILMKQRSESQKNIIDGFLSFMLTYEDGMEVIYCYEIHLEPQYQGKGLGKVLLRCMEEVGIKAGVRKAMLTVFRVNEGARAFYKRMGYDEDEYSPPPRKLRGGKVKESDYIILSKEIKDERAICELGKAAPKEEVIERRAQKKRLKKADHRKRKTP